MANSEVMATTPLSAKTMDSIALVQAELQPFVSLESVKAEKRACEGRNNSDTTKMIVGSYSALSVDETNSDLAKGSKDVEIEDVAHIQLLATNGSNDGVNSSNGGLTEQNRELIKESEVEDWQEVCYLYANNLQNSL